MCIYVYIYIYTLEYSPTILYCNVPCYAMLYANLDYYTSLHSAKGGCSGNRV